MLAINSAKRPHVDGDYFAAQIGDVQGSIYIQPGGVAEFGSKPEVRQGGVEDWHNRLRRLQFRWGGAGGQKQDQSNKKSSHFFSIKDETIVWKLPYERLTQA
jgi:hypothetical protein